MCTYYWEVLQMLPQDDCDKLCSWNWLLWLWILPKIRHTFNTYLYEQCNIFPVKVVIYVMTFAFLNKSGNFLTVECIKVRLIFEVLRVLKNTIWDKHTTLFKNWSYYPLHFINNGWWQYWGVWLAWGGIGR